MQKRTNSPILIFSRQKSSRLSYILDVLFGHVLSITFQQTTDVHFFQHYQGPKVNYSPDKCSTEEIFLQPISLLFAKDLNQQVPECQIYQNLPAAFFHTNLDADLPFDLLAFCFYLLSRYEEYTAPETHFDEHSRFKAENSLAFRYQFLEIPIVNKWTLHLKGMILQQWPETEFPEQSFQFIPSFDIDLAWAYRERPLWRMLAGGVRDLLKGKTSWLAHRWKVLIHNSPDPFDTYTFIRELHKKYEFSPTFFFLLADPSRFDRNINPSNKALKKLIQKIGADFTIGIHPSYQSHEKKELLKKEIDRLANSSGKLVLCSRFHFLKFYLPQSYRRLIKEGILHDYSMGYASQVGFRASIATPYPWYDLEAEKTTDLLIHPFAVMDGTLKNYLNLSPENGLALVKKLIDQTVSVKGTFITLWHNSSFSYIEGWEEWKEVYDKILYYAKFPS